MIKAGNKTTEFWITSAVSVIGACVGLGIIDPVTIAAASGNIGAILDSLVKIVGIGTAALATSSYTQSRGIAKSKEGEKNEE